MGSVNAASQASAHFSTRSPAPMPFLALSQPIQHAVALPQAQARMALPALSLLTPRMLANSLLAESPAVQPAGFHPRASPTKKRVRALPNASKSITLELLRPHFEKPLAEVAGLFGICMTLMKKICRKNGVPRWPHRQIRGLRKSIWSIEKALRCCESETQRRSYVDHLQKQRAKLLTILRGPESSPAGRAAFEQVLAEPCSPMSEPAASPSSADAISIATRPLPSPVVARFPSPSASSGFYYAQHQFRVQQPHPAGTLVFNKPQLSPVGSYTPSATRLPSIASLVAKNSPANHFQF